MSINPLAGLLLQDPMQGLFQQQTPVDPFTALLGGGLGNNFGNLGGTPAMGLGSLLGGQLAPGGASLFGGGGGASQLMMSLVSLLLGDNSPLNQFPRVGNTTPTQTTEAARQPQAAPAPPPAPPPVELPEAEEKTSVKDGKVVLGKDILTAVAKDPGNARKIVEQQLQALGGDAAGKDPTMKVINLFRANNPSTHGHGEKSDGIYNQLIAQVTESAVKQSEPFKAALEQEKAQKQAEAEAQAQATETAPQPQPA